MSAELTASEVLAIERACERLVLDAIEYNDRRDFQAYAALFAPDGILHRPSGEPSTGRAAIVQAYLARPSNRITRHFCTNIRITVESRDRARGRSYALVFAAGAESRPDGFFGLPAEPRQLIGEFDDEFVRTGEGWRIGVRWARFTMHLKAG